MGTRAKALICKPEDVQFQVEVGNETCRCRFQNVLHVPKLEYFSPSIRTMENEGYCTAFGNERCFIEKIEKTLLTGSLHVSLHVFGMQTASKWETVEKLKIHVQGIED